MIRWRSVFCLAVVAVFFLIAAGAGVADEGTPTAPSAAGTVAGGPAPEDMRLWIEPVKAVRIPKLTIEVETGQVQAPDVPLIFHCKLRHKNALNDGMLRIQITDAAGNSLFKDETRISIPPEGAQYQFQWNAAASPVGTYKARFWVTRPPELPVAERTYLVHKVLWSDIRSRFDKVDASIKELESSMTALEAAGKKPPYARMRLAIAASCVERARKSIKDGDWCHFVQEVRYLEHADEAVRALLTFGDALPEFSQPVPEMDLSALEVRDGTFYSGGRPLFLMGQYLGSEWSPEKLRQLRAFGLNFAAIAVGPKDTLAGPREELPFRDQLAPFFKEAAASNISVGVSLDLESMPKWARNLPPGVPTNGIGQPDLTRPAARAVLERHFAAIMPYLADQKMLNCVCIAYQPEFQFTGEEVRQGFLDTVEKQYENRSAVNQSWRSLFADLNEMTIGWDRDNPKFKNTARYMKTGAYQYDWQTYHQQLTTDYIDWLDALGRKTAPGVRLAAASSDRILEPKESMFGIDREALAPLFDVNACCAGNAEVDSVYAIGYPQEAFVYALLRSFAPSKPLANFSDQIFGDSSEDSHFTFETVHSTMWDAAMAGLDISALDVDDFLANPECLEAYATAALDLNRLAEVVQAFQKMPPDVSILWSMPSKIFTDGAPYLKAVRDAFEGCSFGGYKVGFVTEKQCVDTRMENVKVFVMPETPAIADDAFNVIKEHIQANHLVIRTAQPVLYDEHGHTRRDIINVTRRTMLVHGDNLPTEYLHAMDGITSLGELPAIPRTTNEYGYPLEGLKSRYAEWNGDGYVYIINLRKNPIKCWLLGERRRGRDLINGADVVFPMEVLPLHPMLIRLDKAEPKPTIAAAEKEDLKKAKHERR